MIVKILSIKITLKSDKILPIICYEIIYSGKINFKKDFDFIA